MPLHIKISPGQSCAPAPQTAHGVHNGDTQAATPSTSSSYPVQVMNTNSMSSLSGVNSLMVPPAIRPVAFQLHGNNYFEPPVYDAQHTGEASLAPTYAMMQSREYSPVLKYPTPSLMYVDPMAAMMHSMVPSERPQGELNSTAMTIYDDLTSDLSKYQELVDTMALSSSPPMIASHMTSCPTTPLSATSSTSDMEWHDESSRYMTANTMASVPIAISTSVSRPMTPTSTYSSPSCPMYPTTRSPSTPLPTRNQHFSVPRNMTHFSDAAIGRSYHPQHHAAHSSTPSPNGGRFLTLGAPDSTVTSVSPSMSPFLVQSDGCARDKMRKKKETHNAIERRRRDSINGRIMELCHLIPPLVPSAQGRLSKSYILKKSGDYIKLLRNALKKQTERIQELNAASDVCQEDEQLDAFIQEAINYKESTDPPHDDESLEDDRKSQQGYDFSADEGRADLNEDESGYDLFPSIGTFATRLTIEATGRRSVSPAISTTSAPNLGEKRELLKLQKKMPCPKRV